MRTDLKLHDSVFHSCQRHRQLARHLITLAVALNAVQLTFASEICAPTTPSSFDFLKHKPFAKSGWTVSTDGIENTCQVRIVKASLFRILSNAVHRQVGPPFDSRWTKEGHASAFALEQMNKDPDVAIPLREHSEKFPLAKRFGYARILQWEFMNKDEIVVDVEYRDDPKLTTYVERVRYKTIDGKSWFLDEILKK